VPGQETPLDVAWVSYYWSSKKPDGTEEDPLKRKLYRRLAAYTSTTAPPKRPSNSGNDALNAISQTGTDGVTTCEIMRGVSLFKLSVKNDFGVEYNAAQQIVGIPLSSDGSVRPARVDITFRLVHGTEGSTMGVTFTKTVVLPGGKR
ncbi:MAG: hypothetical protein N3A66_12065, partial [Planctomycetota bacterium]|nr:hypothetical protein [Planctomycetota bacterium]